MFAKVFGQIFDSSIAEDYNCRRMFVDLLILADSDGVVDMTLEAISRRTNVPIEEVERYIKELQEPDPLSRSKREQGKRIVPIDNERGWGWQIVNYAHYRNIRDEEARRSYFRTAKRKQRKRVKKNVQDIMVDTGGHGGQVLTSASTSTSSSKSACTEKEAIAFCVSLGLPASDGSACFFKWEANGWTNNGKPIKSWQYTIRSWQAEGFLPSQRDKSNGAYKRTATANTRNSNRTTASQY